MTATASPWKAYRLCFCKKLGWESGGWRGNCWNCGGRGYERLGRSLEGVDAGARVVDVFTRHEWEVVKKGRDGVAVLRSTLTGREIQMNSGANPRYITPEEAEQPGTWDLPEGVEP